jgi:hypothetical protein
MPCSSCKGKQSQPSLEREREREAKAIERRNQAAKAKAEYAERRRQIVATVKAQREARNR